jgi:hypothetical protein
LLFALLSLRKKDPLLVSKMAAETFGYDQQPQNYNPFVITFW